MFLYYVCLTQDLAHKQAMTGRPNITTIDPCSELRDKKPWYERTFSKTRLAVLQKCFKINYEWLLIRPIMSNKTSNTWLLDLWQPNKRRSFNYWFFSAIFFNQCDNSRYLHLSACFNLNCDLVLPDNTENEVPCI